MTTPHVTKEQAIAFKKIGFDWTVNSCHFIHDDGFTEFSSDDDEPKSNFNDERVYRKTCYSAPDIDTAIRYL